MQDWARAELGREPGREEGEGGAPLPGSRYCPAAGRPAIRLAVPGSRWKGPHATPRPRGRSRPHKRGAAALPRRARPSARVNTEPGRGRPFQDRGSHLPPQPLSSAPAPAPAGRADAGELGRPGPRPGPAPSVEAPPPAHRGSASRARPAFPRGGPVTSPGLGGFRPEVTHLGPSSWRGRTGLAAFRVAVIRCRAQPLAVPVPLFRLFCDRCLGDTLRVGAPVIPKHTGAAVSSAGMPGVRVSATFPLWAPSPVPGGPCPTNPDSKSQAWPS